jgi:hypothetical protein
MSSKIKGHFETLWAVKKDGFPRKIFLFYFDRKLKKVGKKVKKGPLRFLKNFFKIFFFFFFLQIPASKTSESRLLASSGFSAPPPPSLTLPPLCFLRPA